MQYAIDFNLPVTCWQFAGERKRYRRLVRGWSQNTHTTETDEKHINCRFKYEFCEEIAKFKLKTLLELDLDISLFGQQSAK